MRIEILGTRGHIEVSAPGYALHSGVLIDDVLFDLGERSYLDRKPRAVFLTHLHADHAFFAEEDAAVDIPMFGPQAWRSPSGVRQVRSTVELDGFRITPVPTVHSNTVRSCAYMVEKDLSRVLYTGDLVSVQQRYRDRIPDLDVVIADGSFMRRGGLVRRDEQGRLHGHTGIPDLVELFSPLAERIVITHFGSWFFRDIDESVKRIEALSGRAKVEAAYDGMVIEL